MTLYQATKGSGASQALYWGSRGTASVAIWKFDTNLAFEH